MKKDTKIFFSTVLGIPLFLSAVWGVHAADERSTVVFQRDETIEVTPEIPEPIEAPKQVAIATVTPKAPVQKPKAVKVAVQPVVVPPPEVAPVVAVVIEPSSPEPAPKKPVAVKKSRRTRAS